MNHQNASSQGRGITVINHWNQIRPNGVVVQQYITNPYLIDGYKFDLRIYAYVASYDPLRVYINRYARRRGGIDHRVLKVLLTFALPL